MRLVAHSLTIGANAQEWYKKPIAMGGGGGSFSCKWCVVLMYPAKLIASSNAGTIGAAWWCYCCW